MHLDLPYHSRRDDLGGVISDQDWTAFVRRLEDVISKVKRKRKRIIRRRKKKGKKLMPRATLFKPPKRAQLDKNPLWKEVFMNESSDNDDASGSEEDDNDLFLMYKETMIAKGIKTEQKHQSSRARFVRTHTEGMLPGHDDEEKQNRDLQLPPIDAHKAQVNSEHMSAKAPRKKKKAIQGAGAAKTAAGSVGAKKMSVQTNALSGGGMPSVDLVMSNVSKSRGESRKKVLRTAAQNYADTAAHYPAVQEQMNMQYKDEYNNIFDKAPYQAGRLMKAGSPM